MQSASQNTEVLFCIHVILRRCQKVEIWTLRSFLLIDQCPGPSSRCDHTYAWNNRELATLLTLSEGLVEGRFEPLTKGSMRKNLTTELS